MNYVEVKTLEDVILRKFQEEKVTYLHFYKLWKEAVDAMTVIGNVQYVTDNKYIARLLFHTLTRLEKERGFIEILYKLNNDCDKKLVERILLKKPGVGHLEEHYYYFRTEKDWIGMNAVIKNEENTEIKMPVIPPRGPLPSSVQRKLTGEATPSPADPQAGDVFKQACEDIQNILKGEAPV